MRPDTSGAAVAVVVACVIAVLCGCDRQTPAAAPAPPTVTVAHPLSREVVDWDEYTGTLASPETVNVVARVSGFIVDAPFTEGSIVKKGQVLFVIDRRPFDATLSSRQAEVARAQTQANLAAEQLGRYDLLRQSQSISQQDYDNAKAAAQQAAAALAAAKAAAETARLDVEWTTVVAPITGRVGRKLVTPGNQVNGGAGTPTLLTTIESVDPIYCYFEVNEQAVLKYQQLAREKKRVSARESRIPCFMQLGNETGFPHEGVIDFVNNRIDPGTGTITARGVFPNPNGTLLPGFFARVRVPGSGRYRALLVPDAAVGTDQNLRYVLVVRPGDTVERRTVELGNLFGRLRAITRGISEDDWVVIDGLLRARPGAKVTPQQGRIPPDALAGSVTAPGSPTTQSLPAVGELPATAPVGPDDGDASPATTAPAARPATVPAIPALPPVNGPATRPAAGGNAG